MSSRRSGASDEESNPRCTTQLSIRLRSPLTARTNRVIGGYAPSEYIKRITNSAAVDRSVIETNIFTHLIDPETLASDDFPAFMSARRERLVKIIETAMGKPVVAMDRTEDVIEPEASDDELDDA